jgi:hypothetical protein
MNGLPLAWEWMGGMLTKCGIRVFEGDRDYLIGERQGPTCEGGGIVDTVDVSGYRPDFKDPATVGCLVFLVRKALNNPDLYCERYKGADFDGWIVRGPDPDSGALGLGDTEIEALLDALKSAEVEESE